MVQVKRIIARIIVIGFVASLFIYAGYSIFEGTIKMYNETGIMGIIVFHLVISHIILLGFGIVKVINWAIDNS